ncbi:MAG: ribonuclease P protein component [Chloroflexi bacterium]|nr:ribonuclease P protein component [Chloroflexota bacterium]
MQRSLRLTSNKQFTRIRGQGDSAANRFLVIRYLPNGLDHSRFGFMVSRRIGNAVVRNRVKRRLREAVRLTPVKAGWDAVFIARRGTESAGYQELKQAAGNLLHRVHIDDQNGNPGCALPTAATLDITE